MELRQLKYFVMIAQELHFGKAAERLDITQPALSKQIRVLEQDIQVQLFVRTKRKVELTQAGKVFLSEAQQLLEKAKQAIALAQRTAKGEIGRLTIGFTPTATYTVLPTSLGHLRSRHPQIEVEMLELSTEAQVTALNRNEIDVGFLHPPIDSRGLKLYPIFAEEFAVVLPKTHHLQDRQLLSLADLAQESFILHSRSEGKYLYDRFIGLCNKEGFQPKIVRETDSHQTRICFVEAGVGITFIPIGLQILVGKNLVCKPIKDLSLELEFAAAWRSLSTSPALSNFLTVLKSIPAIASSNINLIAEE